MTTPAELQTLGDAVGLVLALSRDERDPDVAGFTKLAWDYRFTERQARLVRMLAAMAADPGLHDDLEEFALYLAGRQR